MLCNSSLHLARFCLKNVLVMFVLEFVTLEFPWRRRNKNSKAASVSPPVGRLKSLIMFWIKLTLGSSGPMSSGFQISVSLVLAMLSKKHLRTAFIDDC